MNEARKQNIQTRMKTLWASVSDISLLLGLDKQLVYQKWSDIKQHIDKALAGDGDAQKAIKDIVGCVHSQMKLFKEQANPDPPSDSRDLSLAFWFIKKIEDVDRAERIMKVAIHAVRALKK